MWLLNCCVSCPGISYWNIVLEYRIGISYWNGISEWNIGMEYRNGISEWNIGMEYRNGARDFSRAIVIGGYVYHECRY